MKGRGREDTTACQRRAEDEADEDGNERRADDDADGAEAEEEDDEAADAAPSGDGAAEEPLPDATQPEEAAEPAGMSVPAGLDGFISDPKEGLLQILTCRT